MKTSRLAMAAERGRVGARRAQAWGFVSRIMVSREGGGSDGMSWHQYQCCEKRLRRECCLPSEVLL